MFTVGVLPERFRAKFSIGADGCWIWNGSAAHGRYGSFREGGRVLTAHRFAYEATVGPIPEGLELDHLCRVTLCVNPAHLEPVTHAENVRRGRLGYGLRTTCKAGLHDVTDSDNVIVRRNGGRQCRPCHRAAVRRFYAREAAA